MTNIIIQLMSAAAFLLILQLLRDYLSDHGPGAAKREYFQAVKTAAILEMMVDDNLTVNQAVRKLYFMADDPRRGKIERDYLEQALTRFSKQKALGLGELLLAEYYHGGGIPRIVEQARKNYLARRLGSKPGALRGHLNDEEVNDPGESASNVVRL